jgi:hypothetical protein
LKRRSFIITGTIAILFGKSILNEITASPKKEILTNYPLNIWVQPGGTGDGLNINNPIDPQIGIDMSGPGTTVHLLPGEYEPIELNSESTNDNPLKIIGITLDTP